MSKPEVRMNGRIMFTATSWEPSCYQLCLSIKSSKPEFILNAIKIKYYLETDNVKDLFLIENLRSPDDRNIPQLIKKRSFLIECKTVYINKRHDI